jgi:hypothetical protein
MIFTIVSLGKKLFQVLIILAVVTVVGQVPIKEKTLEKRYHEFVNSDEFQNFYWALMTPVTWTADKVVSLVKSKEFPEVR